MRTSRPWRWCRRAATPRRRCRRCRATAISPSIGPMARSAADLALLLDVIAGPDPLEAGKAYRLALPPPRHGELKDFRVLLIDTDPVMPTDKDVRGGIEKLAANLGKAGVAVSSATARYCRTSPRHRRLYMRMLMSFLGADFLPESLCRRAGRGGAAFCRRYQVCRAERLRGIALSHRDWVMADNGRTRLRAQWRELFKTFDAVICPVMPTPAYPQDHSPEQETAPHQYRRQGLCLSRSAGLARHRHPARPARDRDPDRPFAGRIAGRRADRRPLAGRPHAAQTGRTDRARIRWLCSAADV